MPAVACVLRHGGPYDATYVRRLYEGVARHSPAGTRFRLLTDPDWCSCHSPRRLHGQPSFRAEIVYDSPPGWWLKLWLWRPGTFRPDERVVYIDLDSYIDRDLSPLLTYDGPPLILRDFNEGLTPRLTGMVGGAVITWRGDELSGIWRAFDADRDAAMNANSRRSDAFIRDHLPPGALRIQDVLPGLVACAKRPLPQRGFLDAPPSGAAIVTSWGKEAPHMLPADHWFRVGWEGRAA